MKYGKGRRVLRSVFAVLMALCMCFGVFGNIPKAEARIVTTRMSVTSNMIKGNVRRNPSMSGMLTSSGYLHFYQMDLPEKREIELTLHSVQDVMTGIYTYTNNNRAGEIDSAVLLSTATVNTLSENNNHVTYILDAGKYLIGVLREDPPSRNVAYDISYREYPFIRDDSYHISGTLSERRTVERWKFETFKTGKVTLNNNGTGVSGVNATVYDEAGRKVIESVIMNSGRPKYDFYLQKGVYYLDFSVVNSYTRKYGDYGYDFQFTSTYDSYEETEKSNNGSDATATPVNQMFSMSGTLTANEPARTSDGYAVDTYLFNIYDSSVAPNLTLFSNIRSCSLSIYRIKNGRFYLEYSEEFGPENDLHSEEVWAAASIPTLSKGEHYLKISSKHTGEYSLMIHQEPTKYVALPDVTVTTGETALFLNDTLAYYKYGNSDFSYEMSRPGFVRIGVAEIGGRKVKNSLIGDKAGRVSVAAYGKDSDGNYIQGYFDVIVEFTDVMHQEGTADPYYYEPVYWAATKGITGGVSDSDGVARRFDPQGKCTRAQMISFLWRMAGCPEPRTYTEFSDVKSTDYFYKAVSWAQEKGITGGYSDGTFRPQNVCTRAQAVTFIYRMEGCPEVMSTSGVSFNDIDLTDNKYYNTAVLWAVENGITGGYSDKTFRPDGTCTRAQMVTFLNRDEGLHGVG